MAYQIDSTHSEIGFSVRHMMITRVRGQFRTWTGTLETTGEDLSTAKVTASIEVGSIDTREAARDGHLKSADFFDAENHPKIEFVSKAVKAGANGKYQLVGDITIRGVTKELSLDVTAHGGGKDPWGNERVAFSLHGTLNRTDFGLNWNQALELGGVLVGNEVSLDIEAQVIKTA